MLVEILYRFNGRVKEETRNASDIYRAIDLFKEENSVYLGKEITYIQATQKETM